MKKDIKKDIIFYWICSFLVWCAIIFMCLYPLSAFGQFKFQRSLPDRYTIFQSGLGKTGDSTINDLSNVNITVSRLGNSVYSSLYSYFGNNSLYFDNSAIKLGNSSLFNFSTKDWTIDWFQKPISYNNCQCPGINFGIYGAASNSIHARFDNSINGFLVYINTITKYFTLDLTTWHHIALVKSAGYIQIYADGVKKDSIATSAAFDFSTTNNYIGVSSYNMSIFGQKYIQNIRVSNIARWISNFPIPTKPY